MKDMKDNKFMIRILDFESEGNPVIGLKTNVDVRFIESMCAENSYFEVCLPNHSIAKISVLKGHYVPNFQNVIWFSSDVLICFFGLVHLALENDRYSLVVVLNNSGKILWRSDNIDIASGVLLTNKGICFNKNTSTRSIEIVFVPITNLLDIIPVSFHYNSPYEVGSFFVKLIQNPFVGLNIYQSKIGKSGNENIPFTLDVLKQIQEIDVLERIPMKDSSLSNSEITIYFPETNPVHSVLGISIFFLSLASLAIGIGSIFIIYLLPDQPYLFLVLKFLISSMFIILIYFVFRIIGDFNSSKGNRISIARLEFNNLKYFTIIKIDKTGKELWILEQIALEYLNFVIQEKNIKFFNYSVILCKYKNFQKRIYSGDSKYVASIFESIRNFVKT